MRSRKLACFLMLGFLIALAGCGSDGKGGSAMDGMGSDTGDTVDTTKLNAARMAAMTAYNEAKAAVEGVEANRSHDMASYNKAVEERDKAKDANESAQAATTVADAEKYRNVARTANTNAMKYAGMVTTAANNAANAAMHDAVIAGIVNPMKAGDASSARPTTATNRPGKEADTTFAVTDGSSNNKPRTSITIGTTSDNLGEDDKDLSNVSIKNQFMMVDGSGTTLGQFSGSVHEKTVKLVTDTLTVFTNVDDAKSQAYSMYYSAANAADRDGVTSAIESGALTLSVGEDTGMLKLFSGSKLPSGANQNFNIPEDDGSTPTVEENKFSGTFNGVPGTYACTTGTCSASTNADSKLTLTGSWSFTPTEKDLTSISLPGVVFDSDYLSFGYWVKKTEDSDGKTDYGVGTFFDGSQNFSTTLTAVVGTATYSGKAAGMYGRKTLDQYGGVVAGSATSGHFTADAELMARFGTDGNVGLNNQNQIEGTVSNFRDGGQEISPNWTVELKPIDFGETANVDSTNGNYFLNGTTAGGGNEGNWQGAFFGNPVDETGTAITENTTTPGAEAAPTGVAGEFTAHFTNGHVIGAFGATKE